MKFKFKLKDGTHSDQIQNSEGTGHTNRIFHKGDIIETDENLHELLDPKDAPALARFIPVVAESKSAKAAPKPTSGPDSPR